MFQKSSSKRPREEASFRLSTEEQSWKEYHFFVGQILSYVSTDNCYNQIEVVEISDDEAGNINSIKVRYYGWHQDFDRLFDEWIDVRDEENCKRFGKFETGVHRVKCFVHLPGLPYWPCMGLIREPASDDGLIELRKYNQMYVEPFGDPKEDKDLLKVFKTPSKTKIRQGVHVRYLVNKNRQVLSYKDGLRFAKEKLDGLTGQKKNNYAQALQQLKQHESSQSNFDLCGLLDDDENDYVDEDDDEDYDVDDDDYDDDVDDDGKNKSASSSSSGFSIQQNGNKRGKMNPKIPAMRRQYYHIQSYFPLTDEQTDNFQELDRDAKTCDRRYRLSLRNKQIEQEPTYAFEEKEFMKMWNDHMFEVGGCYAQRYIPMYCNQFIVKYGIEIMQKKLRFQALLHFMNMVEFGRLSVEEMAVLMEQLDVLLEVAEAREAAASSSSSSAAVIPTGPSRRTTYDR